MQAGPGAGADTAEEVMMGGWRDREGDRGVKSSVERFLCCDTGHWTPSCVHCCKVISIIFLRRYIAGPVHRDNHVILKHVSNMEDTMSASSLVFHHIVSYIDAMQCNVLVQTQIQVSMLKGNNPIKMSC